MVGVVGFALLCHFYTVGRILSFIFATFFGVLLIYLIYVVFYWEVSFFGRFSGPVLEQPRGYCAGCECQFGKPILHQW